ncbi:MAG TPA: type II toxin-antitoxin system Phd/YefM family antitoxin [Alphaproteobacteria bacterium]|nr:type II toxin-antitoxin system Phd/YefM family antitoxin [Alphaproteobacteria bacterium]
MQTWQLQEAKAHLSEIIRLCSQQGPQIFTVRGIEEAIIMSKQDYELLIGKKQNLFDFMRQSPLKGLEISIERDRSKIRDIDL